jgi:hypothetical protein
VNRAGPVLFVALLVASMVTAAIVVRARTPDLALEVTHLTPRISPQGGGKQRVARIRFFVRESHPEATVEVVGPNLRSVRTLYTGPLTRDEEVSLTWDGRNRAGAIANPGRRYRLRVVLPSSDRDMVYPRRIEIVEPARR